MLYRKSKLGICVGVVRLMMVGVLRMCCASEGEYVNSSINITVNHFEYKPEQYTFFNIKMNFKCKTENRYIGRGINHLLESNSERIQ